MARVDEIASLELQKDAGAHPHPGNNYQYSLESFGRLLEDYVIEGAIVTRLYDSMIEISQGLIVFNNLIWTVDAKNIRTPKEDGVYKVFFSSTLKTYAIALEIPVDRSALILASVVINGGEVGLITDLRDPVGGIRFIEEQIIRGEQGPQGEGLEYDWQGTSLGVKKETDSTFSYVDLKGEQGIQGPQGEQGIQGPQGEQGIQGVGLEYDWQGTELGIKREDEASYSYSDLKGPKGDKGDKGDTGEIENLTNEHIEDALGYVPADKEEFTNHKSSPLPHQFVNHKTNKTYQFGFQVSVDGKPQIIYEEVGK